mmetsp:Transcript_3401/g.3721  ORF Transcript_3401/g.3721 Transcript_3401/m.3721 type:complete len:370 (+) Transcript_3401:140-1249(+)
MSHSEFQKAVKVENVDKIRQIIAEKDVDLDHFDHHGYTALHNAVMNQNEDMVRALLELPEEAATTKKANCNLQDKAQNGWTPLIHAISNIPANSNHKILYLLVSHGADPNATGKDGMAPIHWAIELDQTSTIDFLLIHKANVELRAPMGDTPLILSARSDQLSCFEFLIKRGANFLAYNDDRENCLHVAIDEKNTQITSFLLEYLKDDTLDQSQVASLITSIDSNGNTPAHVAALKGSSTVADALYKMSGFDQDIKNNDDMTVPELKKFVAQEKADNAMRRQKEKEEQRQQARRRKQETKQAEQESWKEEEDKYQKEKRQMMERAAGGGQKQENGSTSGLLIFGILVLAFVALYGFLNFMTRKEERIIY